MKDIEGFVTVDAYGVDDGVYLGSDGRINASCCHAHVRRKFEAAKSNDPSRAAWVLTLYRQLFDIEDRVSGLSDDDRLSLRVSESLPLLPDAWARSHPESIRTYREAESLARAAATKARRARRRKLANR